MGVHFTTAIRRVNVDVGLVNSASNKNVRGRLEELETSDGAGGNGTGTMAWLGAPGDCLGLLVTNQAVWIRRAPKAPV